MSIPDCIGVPGVYNYSCEVTDLAGAKSPGIGSTSILVKPADNVTFSLSSAKKVTYTPNPTPPMFGFLQTATLTLRSGTTPVGPCSIVCAYEEITTTWRNDKLISQLGWGKNFNLGPKGKWPTNCTAHVWGATTAASLYSVDIPNGFTWDWTPPTLVDRWGLDFTQQQYVTFLADAPIGSVILRQNHRYSFEFTNCCGKNLEVILMVPRKLVVNLVGTQKWPVWESF
jgi:hypothetical protein